ATATDDGKPSNRIVLLKDYDESGFVFYTNLNSRKGQEITSNPFASMCFFWPEINKQIRIEGSFTQVSDEEADKYFNSRPLKSRIAAILSDQSKQIKNNDFEEFRNLTIETFNNAENENIIRPKNWSGLRLSPTRIEFWQRGDFRVHKRTSFFRENINDNWQSEFLYP
ncbi:pyridoxamine 5'-phosphate oxidase, partial [Rickettsiales bacterium]|nr:pyridoxamine 5'-phosphate oxidase [Rickettsiales bacterium]